MGEKQLPPWQVWRTPHLASVYLPLPGRASLLFLKNKTWDLNSHLRTWPAGETGSRTCYSNTWNGFDPSELYRIASQEVGHDHGSVLQAGRGRFGSKLDSETVVPPGPCICLQATVSMAALLNANHWSGSQRWFPSSPQGTTECRWGGPTEAPLELFSIVFPALESSWEPSPESTAGTILV